MAVLYSQYASGTQFTAGTIVGSAAGASGLNPIVDRLNSISTSDNLVVGSMISGTSTQINAGSIIMVSGAFAIESRGSDPASPVTGRMWIRSDL